MAKTVVYKSLVALVHMANPELQTQDSYQHYINDDPVSDNSKDSRIAINIISLIIE